MAYNSLIYYHTIRSRNHSCSQQEHYCHFKFVFEGCSHCNSLESHGSDYWAFSNAVNYLMFPADKVAGLRYTRENLIYTLRWIVEPAIFRLDRTGLELVTLDLHSSDIRYRQHLTLIRRVAHIDELSS